MTNKGIKLYAAVAVAASLFTGGTAFAATAEGAPSSFARPARSLPPQQSVPDLDTGGPAKDVVYKADSLIRNQPGRFVAQAPPYTRIVSINTTACLGSVICTATVAPDGKSATMTMQHNNWIWGGELSVTLKAEDNAPMAGGQFSSTMTFDGTTQPLTVNIVPGTQGVIDGYLRNTASGVNVLFVAPGSNSQSSGLMAGDIIRSFDGTPVTTTAALNQAMAGKRAGATFPVIVERGGAWVTVQLKLDRQ